MVVIKTITKMTLVLKTGIVILLVNSSVHKASQCVKQGRIWLTRIPKAVVGGPAGPAMAGPLFWPKMVSAGPQFFDYSAENVFAFSTFFEVRWPN